MSLDLEDDVPFEELPPAQPAVAAPPQKQLSVLEGRDYEIYCMSAVMQDPEQLRFGRVAHLPPAAFEDPVSRAIFEGYQAGLIWPQDLKGFMARTGLRAQDLFEIERMAGLGIGFAGWLDSVEESWRSRQFRDLSRQMAENPGDNPIEWAARIQAIYSQRAVAHARPLSSFGIPLEQDRSVLLGDRYLNRGDGLVVVSTSGMGKSSLDIQQAVCWALGRPFHGIKPNGPLRSLLVQAEDSDGDIGEVWCSILHAMKLTDEEIRLVTDRVLVVTERVRRGQAFLDMLRALITRHNPDLLHINPLQAFMDGDVTDSKDLGNFLRAGLNGLNEPPRFGYIVVHHTTKPATGKEKGERLWHEVMYDMAGGAEIINWARGIMSLRAAGTQGEFNLVLAKRGTRAGVTKRIRINDSELYREEIVTTIPLRHSTEEIEVPGLKRKLRCIFWDGRDADPSEEKKPSGRGSEKKNHFKVFQAAFPTRQADAKGVRAIHRDTIAIGHISLGGMFALVKEALDDGVLAVDTSNPKQPKYWIR